MTPAITTIANIFGCTYDEIMGTTRKWPIVGARFAVWLILRESGYSASEIADEFKRTADMIRHGLERGRDFITTDKDYAKRMKQCLELLK